MSPGDVFLTTDCLQRKRRNQNVAEPLALSAGIPIFNENTGELFGAVVIRADLDAALRDMIVNTMTTADAVYIVDSAGAILLHYSRDNGFSTHSRGKSVESLLTTLDGFFSSNHMEDSFTDNKQLVALKTNLGTRTAETSIGLVFVLKETD